LDDISNDIRKTVSRQLAEMVQQMEDAGLRRDLVLDGIELGLNRLRAASARTSVVPIEDAADQVGG
jgi:hypothetical protein